MANKTIIVKVTADNAEDIQSIEKFLKLIASHEDKKVLAKASKKVVNKPSLIKSALKFL